jgi:hypothetical protein
MFIGRKWIEGTVINKTYQGPFPDARCLLCQITAKNVEGTKDMTFIISWSSSNLVEFMIRVGFPEYLNECPCRVAFVI